MITTAEIARLAGVSRGTVDRVIHNRGRVSAETVEKVERILKQVNYKPNVFARGLVLSKPFRFGVLIPNTSYGVSYWDFPRKGVERARQELSRYRVEVDFFHYDNYSEESFTETFKAMLASPALLDGLLIAPVISKTASILLASLPNEMPYVLFDTEVPGSACLSYIGPDSFQSGRLSAKLMQILVQDPVHIAIIRELPENLHIDERIRGFRSFFNGHQSVQLSLYEADRRANPQVLFEISTSIIENQKDIKGLFFASSTANEAASVLKNRALEKDITVLGYDLTSENQDCLKDGSIDFLISTKPEFQGHQGIYALYRHVVLKEKIEKRIYTPIEIVTKENLDFCTF